MLPRQLAEVQLQGIDQKTDARLLVPGRMTALENAEFSKTGSISQRAGTTLIRLLSAMAPTGLLLKRLYSLGKEWFQIRSSGSTGERFERTDATYGTVSLGQMACPRAWADTVRGGVNVVTEASYNEASWCVDSCQIDATTIGYVFNEYDGQRVVWYDTVNRRELASVKSTAATGQRVRIMYAGSTLLVALFRGIPTQAIEIYEYTASGATLRVTIPNVYSVWPNVAWDWSNDGSVVYVAHVETTSSVTLIVRKFTVGAWALTSSATWASAAAVAAVGIGAKSALARVFWCSSGGVFFRSYNATPAVVTGTTTIEAAGAGSEARRAIGLAFDGTDAHVCWNVATNLPAVSTAWSHEIRWARVTSLGVVGSGPITTRGAGLHSKPYIVSGDGTVRVFVAGAIGISSADGSAPLSDPQRGYVLLEVNQSNPAIRARLLYMRAGIAPATTGDATAGSGGTRYNRHGLLVNMHDVGDPVYEERRAADLSTLTTIGCAGVSFDVSLGTNEDTPTAKLLSFSLSPEAGYFSAENDGYLFVTGGLLHSFDGSVMRESGYPFYPVITKAAYAAAGGTLVDGTYLVTAVFERIDSRGKLVQSPAATPNTVVISGGGGVGGISLSGTNYLLGLNRDMAERVVIYCTRENSTIFRRVSYVVNSTSVNEWQSGIGSVSASEPALYVSGNEDDHWQPSAPIAICAGPARVFAVAGDEPYRVALSKPTGDNVAPSFYPETYRNVTTEEGPITALAYSIDRLVALNNRCAYVAVGDGPDATGFNDTLGEFTRFPLDVGATDQRCAVVTPDGVIARNPDGRIAAVGTDSPVLGDLVEDLSTSSVFVLDSCYVPTNREVKFAVTDGVSFFDLVWNAYFRAWSVNPDLGARASAVLDGRRICVLGSGAQEGVYSEDGATDAHLASPSGPLMRAVIEQIRFAGIQGFQRVYRLLILGDLPSGTCTIQVRIRYDNETAWAETHTITSANATIGSSALQFDVRPSRQKCSTMAIEISLTSPTGGGFVLAAVAAEIGIKGGGLKLRTGKAV